MSEYLVKSESLTAIADAVRNKVGTTASLSLDAMAITIDSMVIKTTTTINIVPDTTDSFTYDGSVKTPVWRNYDPEQLTISGQTSATNAGTYTVYFTPKADYEWPDGTVDPREVQWSIAKAAGSLSLNATSGTITGKYNATTKFTVARIGDGTISVSSSNSSIATVSISDTTVTVTSKGYGTATITVSVAEGTNYTAPHTETYTITVDYLYLYKDGDKCTSVTGGWDTNTSWAANGWKLKCIFNSSNMQLDHVSSANYGGVATKNKINMSAYTTLKASVKTTHTSYPLYMYAATAKGEIHNTSTNVAAKTSTSKTSKHTISLSVNSVSSAYVAFAVVGVDAYVYKVWLE